MNKTFVIFFACMLALLAGLGLQRWRIDTLREDRDRYMRNTDALLQDVHRYKVRDSLNAARVQSLELSVREFERFRAEDARLIRELKSRNRDLAAVNRTQSETIIDLMAQPRDTVIVRDSIPRPALAVHCGDAWFDFTGVLTRDEFTGKLEHRDSLLLVETVQHKRFLGFLWRTNKVKNRQLDCVSKSPHNSIKGLEYIVIEK